MCLFRFSILHVFSFSLDYFVLVLFAYVVLCLVSSVLSQEIGWEERLRNDLFCVRWDIKPQVSISVIAVDIFYGQQEEPVLTSHPAEGRRLSWHGWLVTYQGGFAHPDMVTTPSTNWIRHRVILFMCRMH